jgi:hypothetical protein
MTLIKGKARKKLYDHFVEVNKKVQTDPKKAFDVFAKLLEEMVYETAKGITITIPAGSIQVAGPTGAMTNPAPIVIQNSGVIKMIK